MPHVTRQMVALSIDVDDLRARLHCRKTVSSGMAYQNPEKSHIATDGHKVNQQLRETSSGKNEVLRGLHRYSGGLKRRGGVRSRIRSV